jgi:tetratricopeptide (TPR) repeat protein
MGDWKKRESLPSALVQMLIAAVVLGGGTYYYIQRGTQRKVVADELHRAREAAVKDNPEDLDRAMAEVATTLGRDSKSPNALALGADIQTERWLTHREPDAEAKAREYLSGAEAGGSTYEERFGAHILQLTADGKADQAAQYAEDQRKRGASGAKLWYGLAEAYEAAGNLALAKQAFQQATDKAWKNPRYFAAAAEALVGEGLLDQAMDMANKGLGANPDHIRSRLALAWARARKGDHVKDASDAVTDILAHATGLTPGLKARALVAQAEVAVFERRFDDALASALKASAADPTWYGAAWVKARAQALTKDAGALASFKAAAAARKTAQAIYFDGAQVLSGNGDTDGALQLLASYADAFKAVTLIATDGTSTPWLDRDDRYWIAEGDVLRAAGKLDESLAAYDRAIAAASVNLTRAYYAKGALLLGKKDYDKAAEVLKLVTPEDGTGHLPEAYLAMGETMFAQKDFPTGCQNYAFALARMRSQQAPRERLNDVLEDVNHKLIAAGQSPTAKLWMQEAKPIIQ